MFRDRVKPLLVCLLLLLTTLLSACGGGDSATGTSVNDSVSGSVLVGITDAEGDFLRYEVNVVSLQLTRRDGLVVDALPAEATPVDFASLVDVTDFLTSATVPNGRYTKVKLTLDYSAADIAVEVGGVAVAAQAVDTDGQPLTTLVAEVDLDDHRPLVVSPGVTAMLTLDFDLLATNQVNTLSTPPLVTVSPLLVAEVDKTHPKTHRLRGPLVSVDTAGEQFRLAIRAHRRLRHDFGQLVVHVADQTVYEINGQPATGSAGLELLAQQQAGTAVIAIGDFDPRAHRFSANEVYAGSSVPGGTLDAVTGTVIGRNGDLLRIQGAVLDRGDQNQLLRQEVMVQLDASTQVTAQLSPGETLATQDISVGQRLTALGTYDSATLTLAAAQARLLVTGLSGFVVGSGAGELDVNLVSLDGQPVSAFDFSGTAALAADDADPTHYQIDSGVLDLSAFTTGTPVHARGFVAPFGTAPPDFTALSLANADDLSAALRVLWETPTTTGLSVAADFTSLDIDPADATIYQILIAHIPTDPDPATALQILPDPTGGTYTLAAGGPCRVYSNFAEFAAAIDAELTQGGSITAVSGNGDYDVTGNSFTAEHLSVAFSSMSMMMR